QLIQKLRWISKTCCRIHSIHSHRRLTNCNSLPVLSADG
ncbi:hypothetical protein GCK32_005277, partial [Trichostrongylus colubriformis]